MGCNEVKWVSLTVKWVLRRVKWGEMGVRETEMGEMGVKWHVTRVSLPDIVIWTPADLCDLFI